MRTLGWMLLAVLGVALMVMATAHLFFPSGRFNEKFSTWVVMAHGLAFPFAGGIGLLLVGALVMRLGTVCRRTGDPGWVLGVSGGGFIVASGLLLTLSATNIALPVPLREGESGNNDGFVMVSWNALDHFDASSAQQIFGELGADVAVLPELENRDGLSVGTSRIEEALTKSGLNPEDYEIFESPSTGTPIAPLAVIVRKQWASYESVSVEQVTFGTLHLVPPNGSGLPEILGIHTAPPVPRWMAAWETDLATLRNIATAGGGKAIIAGDMNGTLRHGGLGGITTHGDALASSSPLLRGTWPAQAPRILRSSIDHILLPLKKYAVIDAQIVNIPGSDHAAIASTISPVG